MNNRGVLAGVLASGVLLAVSSGCSSQKSTLPVYDPTQVGTAMHVERGVVVAVRDVLIKPSSPSGSSAGSAIGSGIGRAATTGSAGALGGAVGAVLGTKVGGKSDERYGEEITISLEGGRTIVVVQERLEPPLAPGEKVQVLSGAGGGYPGSLPSGMGVLGSRGIGYPGGLGGGMIGGNTRVVRAEQFVADTISAR